MKFIIFSILFVSNSLLSCDRTPPSSPMQQEAWVAQVVNPANRHRGIKMEALGLEIQAQIAQKATQRLEHYLQEMPYRSSLQQPAESPSAFFDSIQFWLDLRADATKCSNLLTEAQNLGTFCGLKTEYQNFALQIIEDKKCSPTAAINFLHHACLTNESSYKIAITCITELLLPSLPHMSEANKITLTWVIKKREERKSEATGKLTELLNTLKEKLNV